jgi:hypothetical protein
MDQPDPGSNKIPLKTQIEVNFGTDDEPAHPKLRRWEGVTAGTGVPMNTTDTEWVNLEGNIKVNFSNGMYRPGDYWIFPARATAGTVEFPKTPQPPAGVQHHYAPLGLVLWDGHRLDLLSDCRELFPPLTDIDATDVSYDSSRCPDLKDASNVQEALDELCRLRAGHCTFTAVPGLGWESIFEKVQNGKDAQICFPVGEYPLQKTVEIAGKGNLTLSGCGAGTRILASQSEAALRFVGCGRIVVEDLYAETGKVGTGEGLNGTLSFSDCEDVLLDHLFLKCGGNSKRAAACIAVMNKPTAAKPVRICRCDLKVGFLQEGILLINVSRSYIEDNVIRGGLGPKIPLDKLMASADLKDSFRKVILREAKVEGPSGSAAAEDRVFVEFGERKISLLTDN